MEKLRLNFFSLALILAASFTLSCGGSPSESATRQLLSITVSPADAQNYPSGQVQFTATGNYNTCSPNGYSAVRHVGHVLPKRAHECSICHQRGTRPM